MVDVRLLLKVPSWAFAVVLIVDRRMALSGGETIRRLPAVVGALSTVMLPTLVADLCVQV
jgi:hypothetical protein